MSPAEKLPGVIFVMIGPGGAGKNAIMQAIIARYCQVQQLATATTRPKRGDEQQGREHLFLSETEFAVLIRDDRLLEYQEVTPGKFYGIPLQTVTECLGAGAVRIADIEVLGASILAAAFPENVIQIFVTVPGEDIAQQLEVLKRRMVSRADQTTDIAERLERAKTLELPYQNQCDHVIVNTDLAQAIAETSAIIHNELNARSLTGDRP